jgi:hypothetical protein
MTSSCTLAMWLPVPGFQHSVKKPKHLHRIPDFIFWSAILKRTITSFFYPKHDSNTEETKIY